MAKNTSDEAEDPFDAFGDDDEDDDNSDDVEGLTAAGPSTVAQSLIDAANAKLQKNQQEVQSRRLQEPSQQADVPNEEDEDDDTNIVLPPLLSIQYWPDPLYRNPALRLTSSLPVGGGRGYVASKSIPAGTLVLVEAPMMTWPEDQLGKKLGMESVRHLLMMIANTNNNDNSSNSSILHDMELFHPTKEDVDNLTRQTNGDNHQVIEDKDDNEEGEGETEDQHKQRQNQVVQMMRQLEMKLDHDQNRLDEDLQLLQPSKEQRHAQQEEQQQLSELVEFAASNNIRNRNGSSLAKTDILRLLLALRYNGLESGVYRHVAMLNHDDFPNCAKLLPIEGKTYSEVRTTKHVKKGERLTISYLPRVVSHASRRQHLWDQHRFDIGPLNRLKGEQLLVELIGGSMPPSNIHGPSSMVKTDDTTPDTTTTQRIETATEELEEILAETKASIRASATPPNSLSSDAFDTAKALEQSSLELYESAHEQLKNEKHILLLPILSLHLEACAFVLEDPSLSNNRNASFRLGLLTRIVLSSNRAVSLQKIVKGPDHFDLGSVNLDLANALSELLSRSPERLYELKLPSLDSFAAWSTLEHKARKEHSRIKDLYPHDAEALVRSLTVIE